MGKGLKSSHKAAIVVIVILAVLFVLVTPNPVSNLLSSATGGASGTGGGIFQPPVSTAACGYAPTQKLTVNNEATGVPITALTGVLYRNDVFDGNQVLSTSATFSVDKGESYKWLVANTTDTTYTYYPFFTAAKTGTCTTAGANAYKIRATGTVTSTITNDDGSTVNVTATRTTAESLAAGASANVDIKIKGSTQYAWFGGPDLAGNSATALCADYNTNAIANVTLSSSERTVTEIAKPFGVRAVDTTNSLGIKCWKIDGTVAYSGPESAFHAQLLIDASSTVDPSTDCNVNLRIMDQYIKKRSDNGVYEAAFYDPVTDNTTIGGTDTTDSIGIQ